MSTSALNCENDATVFVESTAATETTELYDAGYDFRLLPPLPAAAIERTPSFHAFWNALFSVRLEKLPPRLIETIFEPAALHLLSALIRSDE